MAKLSPERVQAIVEPHWRRLYNFVFRLTLDRDRAERYLTDVYTAALDQPETIPTNPAELEI